MSRLPAWRRRLLDTAERIEPTLYLVDAAPSVQGELLLIVRDLAAGRRLTNRQSQLLAHGLRNCIEGQPFTRAFGITTTHKNKSARPLAMAADAIWRENAEGKARKVARGETAALFGLRSNSKAVPTAVTDACRTHTRAVEAKVQEQLAAHPKLTRDQALAAVRYNTMMDAALNG